MIEDDPQLLQLYGLAFVRINRVELYLNGILLHQRSRGVLNFESKSGFLEDLLFSKKIELSESVLDENLINALWKLNNNRIKLAHGPAFDDLSGSSTIIWHKGVPIELNDAFLNTIIVDTESLLTDLSSELVRLVKSFSV